MSKGSYADLLRALGQNESGNNYSFVSSVGYLGRFQFSEEALQAIGLYNGDGTHALDFVGGWTGKAHAMGVWDKASFLATPAAQDAAQDAWFQKVWQDASSLNLQSYVGQWVAGVQVTPSGLLAGAHLVGVWNLKSWLESGGGVDTRDPYGTPVSQYVGKFAGYDTPFTGGDTGGGQTGGGQTGGGTGGTGAGSVDGDVAHAMSHVLRSSAFAGENLPLANELSAGIKAGWMDHAAMVSRIVDAADASTSVATLSYQFFVGRAPTTGGLDYLVSPTGGNWANLNSDYYRGFNLENRYINFAVNLGKEGEGRAAFAAEYGGLPLWEATSKAYTEIFGAAPEGWKVASLLGDGRTAYFQYYGQDGQDGLGTKAAMVGWLLAEAAKSDIGVYAQANDAYLTDLADGAAASVDLMGAYRAASDDWVF